MDTPHAIRRDEDRRCNIYVTRKDALDARDAFEPGEIETRSMRVTTDRTLIIVDAERDVHACRALVKLQGDGKVKNTVFHDIYGRPFQYVNAYPRSDGSRVRAHFRKWPGEGEDEETPNVSYDHEAAVAYAAQLATNNQLKTSTICTYSSHVTVATAVAWLPNNVRHRCVTPIAANGDGDGRKVVVPYRWTPDESDPSKYFVLDAAILRHGLLYIALEIQRSHPNSPRKRAAFEEHGIISVQIKASELNDICRNGGGEGGADVFVTNHPISARENWICLPCEEHWEEEKKQREELERLYEEDKKVRTEYEKDKITTHDDPQNGKWLKGFLFVPWAPSYRAESDSDDDSSSTASIDSTYPMVPHSTASSGSMWSMVPHITAGDQRGGELIARGDKSNSDWSMMKLNETQYHYENNRHPKYFKVLVHRKSPIHSEIAKHNKKPICLRLKNIRNDNREPGKKIMYIGEKTEFDYEPGFDLPGYKPFDWM